MVISKNRISDHPHTSPAVHLLEVIVLCCSV